MHSLFVNEHNRIAREIKKLDKNLDDEEIYQQARRFVIAELQNIVYNEFLPVILGEKFVKEHNLILPSTESTSTYEDTINPSLSNEFATFAFRFGHTLVPNLIRTRGDSKTLSSNFCSTNKEMIMKDNFFNFEQFVIGSDFSGKAWQNVLLGLTSSSSQPFSPKISDSLANYLYCVDQCSSQTGFGQDLPARNIQRGRDHGIPGFIKYRKLCGLSVPSNWNDRPNDISQRNWDNLKLAYDDVADIDAFTGGVSEDSVSNGIVGATFACILAEQFKNLRSGDRFFFSHKEDGPRQDRGWSKHERKESQIQSRKLSDIICDNIDLETIPEYVFKADSDLMKCKEKTKLLTSWNYVSDIVQSTTTTATA